MVDNRLNQLHQISDTIELLNNERFPIRRLFRDFEIPANPLNFKDKKAIISAICHSMKQQLRIEADVLYPAARRILPDSRALNCNIVESSTLDYMIAVIESTKSEDLMLDAIVEVLGEYSLQHFTRQDEILFTEIQEVRHEYETRCPQDSSSDTSKPSAHSHG